MRKHGTIIIATEIYHLGKHESAEKDLQKLGRNIKGDSLLLRFVVTSFDIATSVNDTAGGKMSGNDSSRSQYSF